MTLAARLARQLANPHGRSGRLLGGVMDIANRQPLRLAVDLLAPAAGEAILDAGCGTGAGLAEIRGRADCTLTGADRSATMLDAARRPRASGGAVLVEADLRSLPFPSASFDAVLALNVLYFDGPEQEMVRELHRVLRPGGRLIAYVTHRDTMKNWAFTREGLHRLYDTEGLRNALITGGFAHRAVEVQEVAVTRSVRGLLACAWRGS